MPVEIINQNGEVKAFNSEMLVNWVLDDLQAVCMVFRKKKNGLRMLDNKSW
jgi:hypothetical protein